MSNNWMIKTKYIWKEELNNVDSVGRAMEELVE